MTGHHEGVESRGTAERLLVLTTATAFGDELAASLDREGRLVDCTDSPVDAKTRLDDVCHDALVVDHDGTTVDASAVVTTVNQTDPDLPIVVRGPDDAGRLASDVLEAGATTFVTGDAATVADRVEAAVAAGQSAPLTTDQATVYRTVAEDVLASADVGLVVSDGKGVVRWMSDAIGRFFDVPARRLVGTTRRRLIRERLASAVTDTSKLTGILLAAGETERALVRTERLATARWLDCHTESVLSGPFTGGRVDRFVDVTPFVRSDDGLRELQQLMVASEETFAERLHEVLALGAERLDLPYGFVTAIDDGVQRVLDAVGDHELLQPGESAPLLQTYCRKTLAAGGLVTIPDAVEAGWENDPAYETFGLGTYIGAPVVIDGEHYGTLCFAATEPRDSFADEESLFVEFAAAWTGWELERYSIADS